jgi:hypothetical protein
MNSPSTEMTTTAVMATTITIAATLVAISITNCVLVTGLAAASGNRALACESDRGVGLLLCDNDRRPQRAVALRRRD